MFTQEFLDCQFQCEIGFQQITWQQLVLMIPMADPHEF